MKKILGAVRFLTILPVPGKWGTTEKDLAGSVRWFPVVGLMIGGLAAALALGLSEIFPQSLTSVLLVILLVLVSGGLHLDGLSDTADGFLSARKRERIFEIMRDSRVGPMGVTAIVCVLCLKMAALAAVPPARLWQTVLLMPLAGRCALVVTMAVLPYARPEGGLGTVFYRRRPVLSAIWALLVLSAAGWLTAKTAGLAAGAAALVMTLLFAAYTYRKLRGATGDTLGASCEIVELVPALTMAAWPALIRNCTWLQDMAGI